MLSKSNIVYDNGYSGYYIKTQSLFILKLFVNKNDYTLTDGQSIHIIKMYLRGGAYRG